MEKEEILKKVKKLMELHQEGKLGGEVMPEDSNPYLDKCSEENSLYFTLPMALNYQRNSYKLWESALLTWNDESTRDVFDPKKVVGMDVDLLREKLVKYKVALQPNKQPVIWKTICQTLIEKFDGSLKLLFKKSDYDIEKIKTYIISNKKDFPYLSGTKILNYWLYVMTQYTDIKFAGRENISVAPDTHVLQASVRLGIITTEELNKNNVREIVSERWKALLKGSDIQPIDIHTPFWLWSRNGFVVNV